MDGTAERLRELIDKQGVTLKKFCEVNKLNYSGISNIINGERSLGVNILRQLKDVFPNLDTNWLLFGDIQKNITIEEQLEVSEPQEKYGISDPGELMFLNYLDRPSVQEKIKMILKK